MEIRSKRRTYSYKGFIIFLMLYFTNLGSKELFNLLASAHIEIIGVLILSLFLLPFLIDHPKTFNKLYFFSGLLYIIMLLFSFRTFYPEYGVYKAFLGIFIPIFLFGFLYKQKWQEKELINYFLGAIMVIDAIALVYKLKNGFFVRSVSFGLLGSIPFGWLNGMALIILTLKKEKKLKDFFGIILFLLLIFWTGSKGPLVSYAIIALFFYKRIFGNNLKTRWIAIFVLIGAYSFIQTFGQDIRSVRMITEYFNNPVEYAEGAGGGSIGSREYFYSQSFNLIENNPIVGVGFGGWSENVSTNFPYPHNIYLELFSELGLMGILIFGAFLSCIRYRNIFGYLGIFALLCLSFSGDFSYFRYALFPLLISTYLIKTKQR